MVVRNRSLAVGLVVSLLVLATSNAEAKPQVSSVPEVVVAFNADGSEPLATPESVAIDHQGNRYVSLALTGEIARITPDGERSTYAQLPIGYATKPTSVDELAFCSGFYALVGPITLDQHGNLYASVGSCAPGERGVWRVPAGGGQPEQLASLPFESFPNGIELYRGNLYVADSNLGVIWRVDPEQGGAEVWAQDPLLDRTLPFLPGANGVQIFRGELYAAATSSGNIVAIPINDDGSAGAARLHANVGFPGCDDFAFDVKGDLYCATPFSQVLHVSADGQQTEVILDAGDGLDGTTSVYFGRHGGERLDVYITNAAFPMFGGTKPSLLRYHLGVPGARLATAPLDPPHRSRHPATRRHPEVNRE